MPAESEGTTVTLPLEFEPAWLTWIGATTACLRALGVRHDATEVTGGPYALAFPTPIAFHDDPAAARRSKSWGACRIGSIGQGDS